MKHRAKPQRPSQGLLVSLLVGGMLAFGGMAAAGDLRRVNSNEEALAALDEAQRQIDSVREYLKGNSPPATTPPTTTPVTTASATTPPPTSTRPPTTTKSTPPKTTPPKTTKTTPPPPPPSAGVTAAERFGWGTPLPASDEFNYVGAPDPAKWGVYNGPGHAGNGRRAAENNVVGNGYLRQIGEANGDSAGMASRFDQRYGRWEARVRSQGTGPGHRYHPLLIVWPTLGNHVVNGEYDFLENGEPGPDCAEAFLHYPGETPKKQEHARETDCGAPMSEWHNVALEWTPEFLIGYIDGKEWFRFGAADITGMPSGHLTIQLDNFYGGGMQPATYDVDWVRIYGL